MCPHSCFGKNLREEGSLADREIRRPFKKINPEKIKAFIKDSPDAYLKEQSLKKVAEL